MPARDPGAAVKVQIDRRRALRALAALAGGWIAVATALLALAWWDARSGAVRLDDARASLSPEGLVAGSGTEDLEAARGAFRRAHDRAGSWLLAPLRWVPGVRPQLRSLETLAGAAVEVIDTGLDAIDDAGEAVEDAKAGGPARVDAMERLGLVARAAGDRLARVDLGAEPSLGALADAREEFADGLADLDEAVARLDTAATGIAEFLRGPDLYLVFAANNNEMRLGSGTFLSVGWLAANDGELALAPMTPTAWLKLEEAVPLDPDVEDLWGFVNPGREWRNLASTPRFDVTARQALRMVRAHLGPEGPPFDGVLALDPVALDALVTATEPVRVDGDVIDGGEVLRRLLLDQYLDYGDYTDPRHRDRREQLSEIAEQAIANLDAGDWAAADVAGALARAAAGRHFLAWSRVGREQAAWEAAGVSGIPGSRSLLFGVHNRGGNKLDQFLAARGEVTVRERPGGDEVTVEVTLSNHTPPGLPRYVAGPYPAAVGGGEGVYQGIAAFELPPGAHAARVWGGHGVTADGPDGPFAAIATYVKLPRGAAATVGVRFRLPPGVTSLRIEPSARFPTVAWTARGRTWADVEARTLRW